MNETKTINADVTMSGAPDVLFASRYCAVLSPEGFGGRRQPTRAELYERCHTMGDVVFASLPSAAIDKDM